MPEISSPWFAGSFPETQGWHPGAGAYEPGHTGIDVSMPTGTLLKLPMSATVDTRENPGGFGHYEIVTPDGAPNQHYILGHMSQQLVASGHYAAGTGIGLSGSTGWSTGPHLHFEEDVGGLFGGKDVNPMDALVKGVGGGDSNLPGTNIPVPGTAAVGDAAKYMGDQIGNLTKQLSPQQWLSDVARSVGAKSLPDLFIRIGFVIGGLIILQVGISALMQSNEQVQSAEKDTAIAAVA